MVGRKDARRQPADTGSAAAPNSGGHSAAAEQLPTAVSQPATGSTSSDSQRVPRVWVGQLDAAELVNRSPML